MYFKILKVIFFTAKTTWGEHIKTFWICVSKLYNQVKPSLTSQKFKKGGGFKEISLYPDIYIYGLGSIR
jgi:hypothetical protein